MSVTLREIFAKLAIKSVVQSVIADSTQIDPPVHAKLTHPPPLRKNALSGAKAMVLFPDKYSLVLVSARPRRGFYFG
ncbi:MAG: hypothetical protein IPN19_00305 [Elusimicrobia bacterium]|nr:hypothetical protein [Elusimicrobiota bacterium]